MVGKSGANVDCGEAPLGGPYLPDDVGVAFDVGPNWGYGEDVEWAVSLYMESCNGCPSVYIGLCV